VVVVSTGVTLLIYWISPWVGSPWLEALIYASMGVYAWAAWRLEPGRGRIWWRALRVVAWCILLVLSLWLAALACYYLGLSSATFFGIKLHEIQMTPEKMLFASLLVVVSPFVLARTLLVLWEAGRTRLLWRLIYSFLLVAVLGVLVVLQTQGIFVSTVSLFLAPTVV
jgi:hypothetical protein